MGLQRAGLAAVAILAAGLASGATLTNGSVIGKYYFRHVSIATDSTGKPSDARSLIGAVTFDGAGHYTFAAQQTVGNNAAAAQAGSGTYSVDPAGFVALDNPLRAGAKVNARFGPEALVGSSTETADNTFDFFAAIPAPTGGASLAGPYWTAALEFPGGSVANLRNTIFSLVAAAGGRFSDFTVNGHAANLNVGKPATQQVTGATFTMAGDGTGSASFGPVSTANLLSGVRTLYVSADGNVILGGGTAAGSHDIVIGVKAAANVTNASWNDNFWGAGLRVDSTGFNCYAGAAAARGLGKLTWSRREKALGTGALDFTGINNYTLRSDGSGAAELTQVGLGAGGKAFVGSSVDANDPGAYELYFGIAMAPLSGTGIFVNPQAVLNGASFAPAGNPIAPGEFITIFGTGFTTSAQTAKPPYPLTLGGISVLIDGKPSPIYFVNATQINALVPYSTQGPTATVQVTGGTRSNTVTVPVAAASPGVFSLDQSGSGPGAVLHSDFTVVNAASPAAPGETVFVYLTGLGAVTPPVADGTAGSATNLSNAKPAVLVGGRPAIVGYSGLAPGFPGLYQINLTLPALPNGGNVPLAIQIGSAFHDQVDIPIE